MATHAWRIVLDELPDEGRSWDVDVPIYDLEDTTRGHVEALTGLAEDMHWVGEIRRRGEVWRLVGQWRVRIHRHCDRCLKPFVWEAAGELERDYRLDEEIQDPDEESLPFPGEIDLIDVLREEVWLAWGVAAVCSDGCRGLCPVCGHDRNEGECGCNLVDESHPFAALKSILHT